MTMKNYLHMSAIFAALCVLTGGAAAICPAQAGMMVGDYREVAKTDETVVDAANAAVDARVEVDASLKLISIERAELQIVGGSNYRLCLTTNSNDKRQEVMVIMFLSLENEFTLRSWTPGKCASGKAIEAPVDDADDSVSYKGRLEVGKLDSTILYVGEETGDYAAFCFTNKSAVGRAVLAACKNGEQCEFVGKVDFESPCKVKNLEADLSASGRITKIESVKSLTRKSGAAVKPQTVSTVSANAPLAPDAIVKNLYAAQKMGANPFLQTKNRSLVDKYFTKALGDLIWRTSGQPEGWNFDPLYNAQDTKITGFKIGKPNYGEGNMDVADIPVTFKNMGKAETILFRLERNAAKVWKIGDIYYPSNESESASLKLILAR